MVDTHEPEDRRGLSRLFGTRRRRTAGNGPVEIPQRPEEMTGEWFTEILTHDAAHGAVVTGVRCEAIGTDVGFMGEVYRCHLDWSAPANGDLPASVIVKVPTQNDDNFALGDGIGSYEREIVVYRELRDSLGLPMPGFLHGEMDPDPAPWVDRPLRWLFNHLPIRGINWLLRQLLRLSGKSKRRYILVLEDIRGARPPSQIEGGSIDDALAALEVLARFHARNWMRTDALEVYSRIWPVDYAPKLFQASYVRNRDSFLARFSDRLDADLIARLDAIQQRSPDIEAALAAEPWTLLHGDFRLDNLLFRPDEGLVVLDLQGLGYGRPAIDVTYFITTALTADHRTEEKRLLRTYHDALVGAGVTSYSWDQLVHDCALTKELLAHRIAGAGDLLDLRMTEGEDMMDLIQLRVLDWL